MPEEQQPDKKIDLGWKEQAQREKERLAAELDGQAEGPEGADDQSLGELPEPSFLHFVSGLAVQVMMFLGQVENPLLRKRVLDLPAARYNIDVLGILAEKTKGNLTPEEDRSLVALLADLRLRYVETVKAAAGRRAARAAAALSVPADYAYLLISRISANTSAAPVVSSAALLDSGAPGR
jgi:hypothetical protein